MQFVVGKRGGVVAALCSGDVRVDYTAASCVAHLQLACELHCLPTLTKMLILPSTMYLPSLILSILTLYLAASRET